MTIFFFHSTEGSEFVRDHEGVDLPDVAAAQSAAINCASALIAEAVSNGERDYRGRFDVENQRGEPVLTITFACPVQVSIQRAGT